MDLHKLSKPARAAWVAGYQEALADVLGRLEDAGEPITAGPVLTWCRDNGTEATRHHAEALLALVRA